MGSPPFELDAWTGVSHACAPTMRLPGKLSAKRTYIEHRGMVIPNTDYSPLCACHSRAPRLPHRAVTTFAKTRNPIMGSREHCGVRAAYP